MKTIAEIDKIYDELVPPNTLINEADRIISALNVEYIDEIREKFCNEFFVIFQNGYRFSIFQLYTKYLSSNLRCFLLFLMI